VCRGGGKRILFKNWEVLFLSFKSDSTQNRQASRKPYVDDDDASCAIKFNNRASLDSHLLCRAMEKNTTIYPLKIIFLRQNSSFLTYTLY